MRILHLSDTHLFGDPQARHYGRIDTRAALVGLLEHLRRALAPAGVTDAPGVDLVVHTGDASEDGSEESYRLLHDLLDPLAAQLGAPLLVAMGNHDVPAQYARVRGQGDHETPFQDRAITLPGGARAVALDSSVPGAGYGHLEPAQLAWLRSVLAQPAAGGTVLAIHHPPLVAATPMLCALDLDGLTELADVLRGSDVRVVLSGHYHHEMTGEIAGIPVHVAPGVTNVVDPLAAGGHEQAHALSGCSLIELDEDAASAGGPRILTTVRPNAGDDGAAAAGGERTAPAQGSRALPPVYDMGPADVQRIIDSAGR